VSGYSVDYFHKNPERNISVVTQLLSVEFALQAQHETFPDFEIQSRSNFNDSENESRRRPWSLVSFIVDKCELEEHQGN